MKILKLVFIILLLTFLSCSEFKGEDGKDGVNGIAGKDGIDATGDAGKDGENGKDSTSDNEEDGKDSTSDNEEDVFTVLSHVNLNDGTTCSFDQNTYNTFAVPFKFDTTSDIEISKYIALNFPFDAEVSIWTIGIDGNGKPAPGTKLLDITGLKEIILDVPVKLSYNGMLGDAHGLVAAEYYIVIRKDEDFTLSKGCGGVRFYTNYTLASDDEGINWIGDNNNADRFFYFSGVKMILYD